MPRAPARLTLAGSNRLSCQISRARNAGGRSLARAASINVVQTSGCAAASPGDGVALSAADAVALPSVDVAPVGITRTSSAGLIDATAGFAAIHFSQSLSPLLVAHGTVTAASMIAAEAI